MTTHKIVLSADEVKNELHAIEKTGASVKQSDLRYTLEESQETHSLKEFRKELIDVRTNDVNGKFCGVDLSYDKAIRNTYGVGFETFNRALGIKTNALSFAQISREFGYSINNFADIFKLTTQYSLGTGVFASSAPLATTGIDSSLTWIIPETILQYIRLGMDSVQRSRNWIAASVPVRTKITTQPYIKPGDANLVKINEGERIPLGSMEFGQRQVTAYKVGTGIKMTRELQADSLIDIVAIFLQNVGGFVARGVDKSAYMTLVNGDQADNSSAAPVIGVATAGTLLEGDIDNIVTQMDFASQAPNVVLVGKTLANLDLNATLTNRDRITFANYVRGLGATVEVLPYVTANQAVMLNKQNAIIELIYQNMMMESMYDAATQTEQFFVTRYVGHQKLKDDATVILDKSLAIASNDFPASMDYETLYGGFATK